VLRERLNSSAVNGGIRSTICLKTKVGIGSAAELLSGSSRADLMMSAAETVMNSWRDTPVGAGVKVGGGAFIVVARTLATLSTEIARLASRTSTVVENP